MQGAAPSFNQISNGGGNPQGLLEDISTRSLQTVRIGESAGKLATGTRNVFAGYKAAAAGSSVMNSVLLGYESGRDAAMLTSATFVGAYTGASADRSHETTLVGYAAGEKMKDCTQCVGVGAYTLREATALQTTAVGCRALERSLDADYNVGIGAECMQNNRSGSFNVGVGFQAMRAAFTSSECVMVGAYAGYSNALGKGITGVGYRSCEFMEDGAYSVAVGAYSLQKSTYSSNTVAIGPFAGRMATATDAVLIGTNVASAASAISGSVIIGESAASHHEGQDTVILGARAGLIVHGDDCVIIGADALTGGGDTSLPIFANASVFIGRDVAPSLRNASNCVFIGPGADSFRSSVNRGIAIGTFQTTTNDNSISIGGEIENSRTSSVLLGNQLSSDAENSVLVGKGITVKSVIFFKNPLLSPYTNVVARDALNKIGASNVDYTNILRSPDLVDTYLVASAGYLTTPVTNTATANVNLLTTPVTSYDLRTHAPDPNFALIQGISHLPTTTSTLSASNIWTTTANSSQTASSMGLSTETLSTLVDAYLEDHAFQVTFPAATTVNITNFAQTTSTVPYYTPKRAIFPIAAATTTALTVRSLTTDISTTLQPPFYFPSPATAFDKLLPSNAASCNVVFETTTHPTYGFITNTATRNPSYTLPVESVFATTDTFAVRPIQVMKETFTQTLYSLKDAAASATFTIGITEPRLLIPNALPAAAEISISADLITYAPIPTTIPQPEQLSLRLTEIPTSAQWKIQNNTYSSADVTGMITANIDAYPDSQNLSYFTTAKTTVDSSVLNIGNIISPLTTNFNSLLTNLKSLSNVIPSSNAVAYNNAITVVTEKNASILEWKLGSPSFDSLWTPVSEQSQLAISKIVMERAETSTVKTLLPTLSGHVQTSKTAIETFISTTTPLFETFYNNLTSLSNTLRTPLTYYQPLYNAALSRISTNITAMLNKGLNTLTYNSIWTNIQNDKNSIISSYTKNRIPLQVDEIEDVLIPTINAAIIAFKLSITNYKNESSTLFNTLIGELEGLVQYVDPNEIVYYNTSLQTIKDNREQLQNGSLTVSYYDNLWTNIVSKTQVLISSLEPQYSYEMEPDLQPFYSFNYSNVYSYNYSNVYENIYCNVYEYDYDDVYEDIYSNVYSYIYSNVYEDVYCNVYEYDYDNVYEDVYCNVYEYEYADVYEYIYDENNIAVDSNVIGTIAIDSNVVGSSLFGSNVIDVILVGSNVIGLDLFGSNIVGFDLIGSNLENTILIGSNVIDVILVGSNVIGLDLFGSNLIGFDLIGSNLEDTILTGSNLLGSNLIGSNIVSSNLLNVTSSVDNTLPLIEAKINTFTNNLVAFTNVAPLTIDNVILELESTAIKNAVKTSINTYNTLLPKIKANAVLLKSWQIASSYDATWSSFVADTCNITLNAKLAEPEEYAIINTTTPLINTKINTATTAMTAYKSNATPLFTSLKTNLTTLSNVIPADKRTAYNTAVSTVSTNITYILTDNHGSDNYDPTWSLISTNSQWIIDNIFIPNPAAVDTIYNLLASLQTSLFTTYGVSPIAVNIVAIYYAMRDIPPTGADSSRTFFAAAPTNTFGKISAANYDFWWSKYQIPRAFWPLPSTTSQPTNTTLKALSGVIEDSLFKIKLPSIMTSSATTASGETLTVLINKAQPTIHPNWELGADWTVEIIANSTATALFSLPISKATILIPPQYGSLKTSLGTPTSLSDYKFTPSHPFYDDDTTLLVANSSGASQVIKVALNHPSSTPILYTQDIHAPRKPSVTNSTWAGFTIATTNISTRTLSNLVVLNVNDNGAITSSSTYTPISSYNHSIGISSYTSNAVRTRTVTLQEELDPATSFQNILQTTYSYNNLYNTYGFDTELLDSKTSSRNEVVTDYSPPTSPPIRIYAQSNVSLTINEQRSQSFDTYNDHKLGDSLAYTINYWADGSPTAALLYTYNEFVAPPSPVLETYQLPTPNGATISSSLERNLTGASNVTESISTAVLRSHQLATNGDPSTVFQVTPPVLKLTSGPVSQFTAADIDGNIFIPITDAITQYTISVQSVSKTFAAQGYLQGSSAITYDALPFDIAMDQEKYAATLPITTAYVLQAEGGFTNGALFVPNAPIAQSSRKIIYFYANSTNVVGDIRNNTFTVRPRPHVLGQSINIWTSFTPTNVLSSRTFNVGGTFKGFNLANWQLTHKITQASASIGTVLTQADVQAGNWIINSPASTAADTTALLSYSLTGSAAVSTFPIKTYAKDDFPLLASATNSTWQIQRIGPLPAAPTSVLTGQLWTDILRAKAAVSVYVELMSPLVHSFIYDSREPNRQQWRFLLSSVYGNFLTVIPRTPLNFQNETMSMRILYDGRPSPVYNIPFQPLWSIFPQATTNNAASPTPIADIPLSPSLIALGYTWSETAVSGVLRLASSAAEIISVARPLQFIPLSPLPSPSIKPSSSFTVILDQADRYTFTEEQLLQHVNYSADVPLIFYLTKIPTNGVVLIANNPATRFVLTNGSLMYQHNGSLTSTDTFELHVASGPFDLSTLAMTVNVSIRPIPYVNILKEDILYATSLDELNIVRRFDESLFEVTAEDASSYIHILDTNYLIPSQQTYAVTDTSTSPISYTIDPDLATSTNPPITLTFTVNATETQHVNPLAEYDEYSNLFKYTMSATMNHHTSINAFQERLQPEPEQGFTYSIDRTTIGSINFIDRSVSIYMEYEPTDSLTYKNNPVAAAQVEELKRFKYVFEGLTDSSDAPLFRFEVTHSSGVVDVKVMYGDNEYSLENVPIYKRPNAFHSFYFVSNDLDTNQNRNTAFYIGYSFDDTRIENTPRNILKNANIPPINLDTITSMRFIYDLDDPVNFKEASTITKQVGILPVTFDLRNYATTLQVRNFQILINTSTITEASGGDESNDTKYNVKYNVVIGNGVQVRGVDNICIGSTFTTSGRNSIILGNNIGVVPGSTQVNEIYESIVVGSESFANAFVRDVIAIGKNIYNDLIDVDIERVAEFLSYKPILVGNDITKNMLDFHVNIGNTFLSTGRFGNQIYLGVGDERVGVGFTSNNALGSSAKLHVNGAVATTSIALNGPNGGSLGYFGYTAQAAIVGDIVRYSNTSVCVSTTALNDPMVIGVWSGSNVITAGRSKIFVTGTVNQGDLLTSAGPSAATPGTAIAQTGPMAQVRMSYTVAKALEAVTTSTRILIECFVLSG